LILRRDALKDVSGRRDEQSSRRFFVAALL
jgi:hypothetical protein